jgi:UV DNA damage endonuclease
MSDNGVIQLGLCCLNLELRKRKPPIFASRSVQLKTLQSKGIDNLKEKIIENLKDTLTMLDWNEDNGIKVLRLSSDLFPHKSNSKAENYDFDFAKDLLLEIGNKAKKLNHRITFHPGQYNVIGSPSKQVLLNTINDLKYHSDVLDLMGMDQDSVMVIHGGGTYKDKNETIKRWCLQYNNLEESIKKRLVLENCEKNFSIEDCLKVSQMVNIPVVFDTHHFECYKLLHPDEKFKSPEEYIPSILDTWYKRKIKPKFHVSEQGSGKIGHHSDYIEEIPQYLLNIPEQYQVEIDIMIEAKMKEKAIFHLYSKYPFLNLKKREKNIKKKFIKPAWTNLHPEGCGCCN